MDAQVVTKTEFAKLCNVTAGRVSQWISEGKIGPGEMIGEGRAAKIHVERAREKLKLRIDSGQRVGNGAETRLAAIAMPSAVPADDIDIKLKQARLEQAEATNRKLREEELARRGVYVRAEHASAEAGKLASTIIQMTEGAITEMASEIAAKFQLPARDVTHMMRKVFRLARARMAEKLANDALASPDAVEDEA
jgi:hypothetical protein